MLPSFKIPLPLKLLFFIFYKSHQFNLSRLKLCFSLLRSDRRHIFFKLHIKQLPEWIASSSGAASQHSPNAFADRDVCSYVHFFFSFVLFSVSRSVPRCKIHFSLQLFASYFFSFLSLRCTWSHSSGADSNQPTNQAAACGLRCY